MSVPTAGHVVVATGTGYTVTGVDPSTLGVGVPNVNANSLFGNNTGSTAPGASLDVADVLAMLSLTPAVNVLLQSGIPFLVPPQMYVRNNGQLIFGAAPASSATASFSALSGSGVTMTMSAASLLGTSADVGRVLTIDDGGTFKYATITTHSSTTVATVTLTGTLSGTGPFANNVIWLTGAKPPPSYPNLYVYMAADAIYSGSAVGWYYGVSTSTTVCVLYNNTYNTGNPAIPGSPTAFSTTGPGNYAPASGTYYGPEAELVGGSMGTNGRIDYSLLYSLSNTTNLKRVAVNFGGQEMYSEIANTTTGIGYSNHGSIANCGKTNRQVAPRAVSGLLSGDTLRLVSSYITTYNSVDTTTDQTFAFMLATGASSDWLVIESYSAKVYKQD